MFRRLQTYRLITVLALAAILAGCMGPSPEEKEKVQLMFEDLRNDRIESALARMPDFRDTPDARSKLAGLASLIPSELPQSEKTISWSRDEAPEGKAITITDELTYPDKVLLRRTVIGQPKGKEARIVGFHINVPSPAALEQGRFALPGKSAMHYLFLAAGILIPLVIIVTLVVLFRTKGLRRKWLWAIFIALGLGKFSINWATGAIGMQFISFSILGAGITKLGSSVDPWVISLGIPMGALVFLAFRHFRRPPQPEPPPAVS